MGSWWQNQLSFAEKLIEKASDSAEQRVQSAVGAKPTAASKSNGAARSLPLATPAAKAPPAPPQTTASPRVPSHDRSDVAPRTATAAPPINSPWPQARGFSSGDSGSDDDDAWGAVTPPRAAASRVPSTAPAGPVRASVPPPVRAEASADAMSVGRPAAQQQLPVSRRGTDGAMEAAAKESVEQAANASAQETLVMPADDAPTQTPTGGSASVTPAAGTNEIETAEASAPDSAKDQGAPDPFLALMGIADRAESARGASAWSDAAVVTGAESLEAEQTASKAEAASQPKVETPAGISAAVEVAGSAGFTSSLDKAAADGASGSPAAASSDATVHAVAQQTPAAATEHPAESGNDVQERHGLPAANGQASVPDPDKRAQTTSTAETRTAIDATVPPARAQTRSSEAISTNRAMGATSTLDEQPVREARPPAAALPASSGATPASQATAQSESHAEHAAGQRATQLLRMQAEESQQLAALLEAAHAARASAEAAAAKATTRADESAGRAEQMLGELAALKAAHAAECDTLRMELDAERAARSTAGAAASADVSEIRGRLRDAQQRAALKADQVVSCEARLTAVEGEAAAATTALRERDAEVAQLRAEAARMAAQSAQESQEYVQSLQQEVASQREAAAAATAAADRDRRAAADVRATLGARVDELEAALAAAVQEAAASQKAAEDAVEALEASEARTALQAAQRGAGGAERDEGAADAAARAAAAEGRAAAAEAAAAGLRHRVAELEEEAATQATPTHFGRRDLQAELATAQQLLAERQGQWEAAASARAARILALERQLAEAQSRAPSAAPAARGDARGGLAYLMDDDVVPMASLRAYSRMSGNRRIGAAVKAFGGTLDSVTAQLVRTLRRSPLVRLVAVAYLLLLHVYVYFLVGRMQRHSLRHSQGLPHVVH